MRIKLFVVQYNWGISKLLKCNIGLTWPSLTKGESVKHDGEGQVELLCNESWRINMATVEDTQNMIHNGWFESLLRVFMWHHIKQILQIIILGTAMLVSFLHSLVLENTTKCPRTLHLVHIIIPNYNRVTRILAQTLGWNLKSCFNRVFCCCCCFFKLCCKKRKLPRSRTESCAYKCVLRRANPLLLLHNNSLCVLQNAWPIHLLLSSSPLRGHYTPNQKLPSFVLYLKIINTFLKNSICIL